MKRRRLTRSKGFALVAALFLLIVVGVLGTFAMRLNVSQQSSTDLELGGVRADAALHAGTQYAAARLLAAGCDGVPTARVRLPQSFSVTLDQCGMVANSPPVTVFSIRVTASRGQYGSPDFVSRRHTVLITQ